MKIRKGIQKTPLRILLHGNQKVGKSTFAAGAPSPVFIPLDDGVDRLDVHAEEKPTTIEELNAKVLQFAKEKHDYKTLVIDSLNLAEPLIYAKVTGGKGDIRSYGGGYGKGEFAALDHWRALLVSIETVWRSGMAIVILTHSAPANVKNPGGEDYQRMAPAMNQMSAGIFLQWVDAILYAALETGTKEKAGGKARAVSTGVRLIHAEPNAAYEAGNRLGLPDVLPLSWAGFEDALAEANTGAVALREEISDVASTLGPEVQAKALRYVIEAGSRTGVLRDILQGLIEKKAESQ